MIKRLLSLAAGLLLLLTLTGFMGEASWLLDLTSHFRIQYLFTALILLVLSTLLHPSNKNLSGALAVTVVINALVLWPYLFPSQPKNAKNTPADFTVLQLNLWQSNDTCQETLDWVLSVDANIVAMQEVDANCFPALAKENFQTAYPYQVHAPQSRIMLASKTPLESRIEFASKANKAIIIADTKIDDHPLRLMTTHTQSPSKGAEASANQLEHLQKLAQLSNTAPDSLVVLGDFNTTPFSHAYRTLINNSNLQDTMAAYGLKPSFPARCPVKQFPHKPNFPFALIPIDHILYQGNIAPLERKTGPRLGSDHYPIISMFKFKDASQ